MGGQGSTERVRRHYFLVRDDGTYLINARVATGPARYQGMDGDLPQKGIGGQTTTHGIDAKQIRQVDFKVNGQTVTLPTQGMAVKGRGPAA